MIACISLLVQKSVAFKLDGVAKCGSTGASPICASLRRGAKFQTSMLSALSTQQHRVHIYVNSLLISLSCGQVYRFSPHSQDGVGALAPKLMHINLFKQRS